MARKRGLQNFNLLLIRYLMRVQSKDTTQLAAEIDVTRVHLSGVLNRQRLLSEEVGKRLSGALGVSWEVLKQREEGYFVGLIHLSLATFLHEPGALDWTNAVKLADKMGILKRGTVDSSEPTDAQNKDEDLLELGDVPEALGG